MEALDPPLLERDSHLDVLARALAGAAAGRGSTIVVEGPAGTGKTALLQAAVGEANGHGLERLSARGSEIEQEFAFGLSRQLLEPPLSALDGAARERLLSGPARPAALAVAPEHELDNPPPEGFAMMHALFLVTAGLAERRPLVLCVDDAHWADASSLRALSYLAGRIAELPVALAVSVRPHEPGAHEPLLDQLRAEPGVQVLKAAPLGDESVATVVRRRLPGAGEQACRAAAEATAGNPLYLAELLRAVTGEKVNGQKVNGDMAGSIQRAALPSLGDRVARRIARVADRAPELAAAMAVLGDGNTLALAAALAEMDAATAGQVAGRLRRIEVLDAEDPFVFVHPLVRRSVYDALSTSERDSRHHAAADLLEGAGAAPEVVAAHRAAIRPAGSVEAARAMTRAAAEAMARGAPDEAVRWHTRALEEGAPEPSRAELLAALGEAEVALLDPAALDHLREALRESDDPALIARVAVTLAPALFASGRWTESADIVATALRLQDPGNHEATAELTGIALLVTGYSLDLVARLPSDPAAADELTRAPGWAPAALAATRAAHAVHTGDTTRARDLVERALEDLDLLAQAERGIWATSHLLVAMAELDDAERALAVCQQIHEQAERAGSLNSLTSAVSHMAWIQARQGNLAEAVAALDPHIEGAMSAGNPTFVAAQLFYLQDALLERSGMDELAGIAQTFDIQAAGLKDTWMGAMVHLVRGRLHAAAMRHAEAADELRAAHIIARGLSMGPAVAPTGSLLALALPAERSDEAAALVAEELELARATGLARPEGIALRAAGILAADGDGVPMLRESVSLLESCGARIEQARSLLALGAALRRSGARREARVELNAAAELARASGADRLVERALDELRVTGSRPRRMAANGPAALTASELRVARLAAQGATTRAIAQELVVSQKTVETHLTHAYAKLGLSGAGARGQLSRVLEGD